MKENPYRRACAVCGRVLDAVTEDGGLRWRHVFMDQPADHVAIPVLPAEIAVRGRCDFCSADDPRWYVPARPFAVDSGPARSTDDWAACDDCVDLIRTDRWTSLRRRVVRQFGDHHPGVSTADAEALGRQLGHLWRQLRKNITGAPALIPAARMPNVSADATDSADADRDFAVRELDRAGLRILARDWQCVEGQIDIVAGDGDTLVICEVRTCSAEDLDKPDEVSPGQAAQYRRTALRWLASQGMEWLGVRFDRVTVLRRPNGTVSVQHRAGIC